jgi:hypothetical protein
MTTPSTGDGCLPGPLFQPAARKYLPLKGLDLFEAAIGVLA